MTTKDWIKGISGAILLSALCGFVHADTSIVILGEGETATASVTNDDTYIYNQADLKADINSAGEEKDLINKKIEQINNKIARKANAIDNNKAIILELQNEKNALVRTRQSLNEELETLRLIKDQFVLEGISVKAVEK